MQRGLSAIAEHLVYLESKTDSMETGENEIRRKMTLAETADNNFVNTVSRRPVSHTLS